MQHHNSPSKLSLANTHHTSYKHWVLHTKDTYLAPRNLHSQETQQSKTYTRHVLLPSCHREEEFRSKYIFSPKGDARAHVSPHLASAPKPQPASTSHFGTRGEGGHPLPFQTFPHPPGPRTTIGFEPPGKDQLQSITHLIAGLEVARGLQTKPLLLNSVMFHFSH